MRNLTSRIRDAMLPIAARTARVDFAPTDDVIFIFQPDHLGDILLSQIAVRHLRSRHPRTWMVGIVGPWSKEIAGLAWPVDEIITIEFPGFARSENQDLISPYRQLPAEARRLAPYRARAAYVLRPDAWWAAWLAALVAPTVVTAADPRTSQFSTNSVQIQDDAHAAIRAWSIASEATHSETPTPESSPLKIEPSEATAAKTSQQSRCPGVVGPYAVIHPGAGAAVKEWPIHRWQSVARSLASRSIPVVLTGSVAEVGLCDEIVSGVDGIVSLAGRTSVTDLAELLRGATLVIGPDCGPLHLAVAVGTPTVHLFGPSDPNRYGPWGSARDHRVVSVGWTCPSCGDLSASRAPGCGCMLAITPEVVLSSAASILQRHER